MNDETKLFDYIRGLGVAYVVHDLVSWKTLDHDDDFYEAPFTRGLGVRWSAKEIHDYRPTRRHWAEILHEAGHLVATDLSPNKSEEYDFLGWELAVIKKLGLSMQQWYDNNREYSICSDTYNWVGDFEFGSQDFLNFVNERIQVSRDLEMLEGL